MRELLNDFRVDERIITFEQRFCEGLGRAYEGAVETVEDPDRRISLRLASASNFRRAAAHSILLDDAETMSRNFRAAARQYAAMGSPYAVLMSVLANGPSSQGTTPFVDIRPPSEPAILSQFVYAVLFSLTVGMNPESGMSDIVGLLERQQAEPVGVLGLPVGAYLTLLRALIRFGEAPEWYLDEALLPFFRAFDSAIVEALQDAYHWRRLEFEIHPAEPDIIGLAILVEIVMRNRNASSLFQRLERFNLSWQSNQILMGALRLHFR
jgi:hypothetical protein